MRDDLAAQVAQLARSVEGIDRRLRALEGAIRSLGQSPANALPRRLCQCASCRRKREHDDRLRVLH